MQWLKVILWANAAAAWTLKKAEVAVSGSGDIGERVPVSSLTAPVELFAGRSLDIAFTLDGANEEVSDVPHQALLRLYSVDGSDGSKIDKFVPARVRKSRGKVVVPYKQIPEALHNRKLQASLLVSGFDSDKLEQPLFEVYVLGENDDVINDDRTNGFARSLGTKPEIIHQFPAPVRHVNAVIALVFVAAIDVLFAMLLKGWGASVGSITLPDSPARLALVGLIGVIEVCFTLYYFGFSIFVLLTELAVLLPALFVLLSRA